MPPLHQGLPITAYERAWKTQKWESSSAIDKSGRRRNCSGNKTNFPFPFNSAARNARMRELMSISSRRTFNCLPFTVLLMVHNLSAHNKMWKKRGSLIYWPSLKFHYTLVNLEIGSLIPPQTSRQGHLPQKLISQFFPPSHSSFPIIINSHHARRAERFNFNSSGKNFQQDVSLVLFAFSRHRRTTLIFIVTATTKTLSSKQFIIDQGWPAFRSREIHPTTIMQLSNDNNHTCGCSNSKQRSSVFE